MSNTKEETIERLCKIVTKVGEHFEHTYAHDCFCHEADPNWDDFRCDDEVLDFIEEAVNEKLEENNMKVGGFYRVTKGLRKHYKGWTKYKEEKA